MEEDIKTSEKKPSKVYYLLPIFLNILGGVIGYFLVKDKDRKFAERLLIVGVIMIVVAWVVQSLIAYGIYLFWF
jgi:hypothetical protein